MRRVLRVITKKRLLIVLGILLGVIALQHVLYFLGLSVGFIDSERYTGKIDSYVASKSQKLASSDTVQFTLQVGTNTYKEEITTAGTVSLDEQPYKKQLQRYDARMLLPFYSLFLARDGSLTTHIRLSDTVLSQLEAVSAVRSLEPVDAKYYVQEKEIRVRTEEVGLQITRSALEDTLRTYLATDEMGTVTASEVQPLVTTETLRKLLPTVEQKLQTAISFSDSSRTKVFSDTEKQLVELVKIDTSSELGFTFDDEELRAFFSPYINEYFGRPDSPTIVQRRAGIEELRTEGTPGVIVSLDDTQLAMVKKVLTSSEQPVVIPVTLLYTEPALTFIDLNDNTLENLKTLLGQLATAYDASISVKQLYGERWQADSGGGQQRIAASTYKLVVAHYAARQVTDGVWSWGDPILSTTLEECVRRMLVVSDNDCPQELIYNRVGAQEMTSYAASLGMLQTCFGCNYAKSSTNDQIIILDAIHSAQSLSSDSRDKLIAFMRGDIYRSGIPSASTYPVASKAGFVLDIKNDSAIISTPDGDLLISIYTRGESWRAVQDVTRRVLTQLEL